jgi:hypothetical protein
VPGMSIHRKGKAVPRKRGLTNKTVNSSGSRSLRNRGSRPRIHGGFDAGRIA